MTWVLTSLAALSELIAMGPFGSAIKKDRFVDEGIPVINGKNLHRARLDDSAGYEFISESHADDLSRSNAFRGDLVVTHRGTLGQVSLIPHSSTYERYVVSQSQLLVRPAPGRINAEFLTYYLRSDLGQRQLLSYTTQTGVPSIAQPTASMKRLLIPTPSLPEQRAIARVLGALDDKIASNATASETTDRLLEAVFDRLFTFKSSASLSSIAEVNALRARPILNGDLRYLDISSVGVGRADRPSLMSWASAPGRARRGLRTGDTVWSTVRPNRRSHALILDPSGPLVASTALAVLSPTQAGPAFLYEATRRPEFAVYLENVAEGSAYPAVRAERFLSAPVPDADKIERDAFESFAMPLRTRQQAASSESVRLAEVRDALLPELMSGRLQVKDAERAVEEVL